MNGFRLRFRRLVLVKKRIPKHTRHPPTPAFKAFLVFHMKYIVIVA